MVTVEEIRFHIAVGRYQCSLPQKCQHTFVEEEYTRHAEIKQMVSPQEKKIKLTPTFDQVVCCSQQ